MADKLFSEFSTNSPIEAVEASVKHAIISLTGFELSKRRYRGEKPSGDVTELVRTATRGQCYEAGKEAVCSLALNNRDLFKTIILISTKKINADSWLRKGTNQTSHTYFAAQDNDGRWYASSPANEGLNEDPNYPTTILQGESLSQVIGQMTVRDRAEFPSEESILKEIGDSKAFLPRVENSEISIYEFKLGSDGSGPEAIKHRYSL